MLENFETTRSSAGDWAPLARFVDWEAGLQRRALARGRVIVFVYEFLRFGVKQAWACLFGALMLALLIGSHLFYPRDASLARYDFLVLASVILQAAMIVFRLETWDEAKVIFVFHIAGTVMEIFKTSAGSWIYPEPGVLRIAGVPLFTGFMYAAVGSFIARCWRLFDFQFENHPPLASLKLLAAGIYVNFFSHHFMWDFRPLLFLGSVILFGRCWVCYKVWHVHRRMPLLVAAVLTAIFIWLAENIGTFTSVWVYPSQRAQWHMVSSGKLGAWFLLMIVSYALVASVNFATQAAMTDVSASHNGETAAHDIDARPAAAATRQAPPPHRCRRTRIDRYQRIYRRLRGRPDGQLAARVWRQRP